jgi:3-methyl-2-oxobutanoate hydroxymethyltransferase
MMRVPDLQAKKLRSEKIVMLTAYDAWMSRLLAETGAVDLLLVGDSLGMIELGYDTTVPVTTADIARHSRAVRAGAPTALIVADMPFLSHQVSAAQALRNAGTLIQEGRATAVKIEGGSAAAATVRRIVDAGIPVMGHLGLQPQHVHAQGGFRRQAKRPEEQRQLVKDAQMLEEAGAFAIVLECIPDEAARDVTLALRIPTIGIGSGPHCDGQVLVTHDILGLSGAITPPFVKQYASLGEAIAAAAQQFSSEVRSGEFPANPARRTSHA